MSLIFSLSASAVVFLWTHYQLPLAPLHYCYPPVPQIQKQHSLLHFFEPNHQFFISLKTAVTTTTTIAAAVADLLQ
jgi:hypothetical protein